MSLMSMEVNDTKNSKIGWSTIYTNHSLSNPAIRSKSVGATWWMSWTA